MQPSHRHSFLALILGVFSGCSDVLTTPGRHEEPLGTSSHLQAMLECSVSIDDASITCLPLESPPAAGRRDNLIVGGQGEYLDLIADSVTWNLGAREWSADLIIENLTTQPFATADGHNVDPDGSRMFIFQGPTGGVDLTNPSGTATFTGAGQKYIQYDGIIDPMGGLSDRERWTFSVPLGTNVFQFIVFVHTTIPDPGLSLHDPWDPPVLVYGALALDTSSYVRAANQTSIGNADRIAVKFRISGASLRAYPSGSPEAYQYLFEIGDGINQSGVKLQLIMERSGQTLDFHVSDDGNRIGHWNGIGSITRSQLDPNEWYSFYVHWDGSYSPSAQRVLLQIAGNDGILLSGGISLGSGPETNSSEGQILIRRGWEGGNRYAERDGTFEYDGFAVYGNSLPVADRFRKPLPTDPDLLSLTYFDEPSGATSTNLAPGGNVFTLVNPERVYGDTWEAGLSRALRIVDMYGFLSAADQTDIRITEQLAIKIRISGREFIHTYERSGISVLWAIGSSTNMKLASYITIGGGDLITFLEPPSEGVGVRLSLGDIVPDAWYTIYYHYDPSISPASERTFIQIFDEDGLSLDDNQSSVTASLSTGTGAGEVRLGHDMFGSHGSGNPRELELDAFAIYDGPLPPEERATRPVANDPRLLSLTFFDEGSGTTLSNLIAGANPFLISEDHVWIPGSTWSTDP